MNLGALFEAYGQTAGPFFKGQADAEQAGADERRKNIESWLNQQQLKLSQQEADRRQQFGQQELDLRRQEQNRLSEQQQILLKQLQARLAQQEQTTEAERVAGSPDVMRQMYPQRQVEEGVGEKERTRLGPWQYPTQPPITQNPFANTLIAKQFSEAQKAQENADKVARERDARDKLGKLDYNDPDYEEKARQIMYEAGDYRYAPRKSAKEREREQDREDFTKNVPEFATNLKAALDDPNVPPLAKQGILAALQQHSWSAVAKALDAAQKHVETANKQKDLQESRKERATHWKAQEDLERERINIARNKITAVKPNDKNGAKELQGYITKLQADRFAAYKRIKDIDTALAVPTISEKDAINLRAEKEAKQALIGPYEQAISEAELRLKSTVFGTGTPAPTGSPATGATSPVVPPSPSPTPTPKPQGIRVPLPGGGEAIVTPH